MNIVCISIFPDIFTSFKETSLVKKARENGVISIQCVDPRQFCTDNHQQIDDSPYGGGAGLVLKAQPLIDAIKTSTQHIVGKCVGVVVVQPSKSVFVQETAHTFADGYDTLVFVCGRYEGIDYRVNLWGREKYGTDRYEISLGKFVTLGGEAPAMTMIESIVRLVPGVIKEQESWEKESYRPEQGGEHIEHPHYTRPLEVEGHTVPDVLLSGNHAEIEKRRDDMMISSQ